MNEINILHLEDNVSEAELIKQILAKDGIRSQITLSESRKQFLSAIETSNFELILSDSGVPDLPGRSALQIVRQKSPEIPFIFVSGNLKETDAIACWKEGATDYVRKDELWRLAPIVERITKQRKLHAKPDPAQSRLLKYNQAMELLVVVVRELSQAKDLNAIAAIVRSAARKLTGADGATFVLREGDMTYYADEDAIAPLWKGKRFPMDTCIGGWSMKHRQQVIIEDVYGDERIPIAAYKPTFIKSMLMVPICQENPIGAIGNYWAKPHAPTPEEVKILQALADTTAVAIENVYVYCELEQRVKERTLQLEASNKELEAFSYTLSHDLRNPLSAVIGFSELLQYQYSKQLDQRGKNYIKHMLDSSKRMRNQIEKTLSLYKLTQTQINVERVNLSELALEIISEFQQKEKNRQVEIVIEEELTAFGDRILLQVMLENLLSNAWKYSSKKSQAIIKFRCCPSKEENFSTFYVKDNGAGFDLSSADRLFEPFQRMHSETQFPGNGVGLASVQRIVNKHGGQIWVEAIPEQGATFYFSLPTSL
jgi:signal transduction histidine kinase/FixJ family two-component response regulator